MKASPIQAVLSLPRRRANLRRVLSRLHRDERGAEGLEKLLIVAAIVLPLLGVLVFFRNEISDWVDSKFSEVRTDAENEAQLPGGNTPP